MAPAPASAPQDERLLEAPLFLACTRPAMVFGAPMEAVGVTLIGTATLFLAHGALADLLVAPALHLVCRGLCAADPNAFRVLRLFLETKGRARNGRLWGGSSTTPLPLARRHVEVLSHG